MLTGSVAANAPNSAAIRCSKMPGAVLAIAAVIPWAAIWAELCRSESSAGDLMRLQTT